MYLNEATQIDSQLQRIEQIKTLLKSMHIPKSIQQNLLKELSLLTSFTLNANLDHPHQSAEPTPAPAISSEEPTIPTWRLKQLVDGIPVAITFIDKSYRYQFDNPRHRNWYGKSESEMLGCHLKDMLGEKLFKYIVEPIIHRALEGETVTHEVPFSSATNSKYYRITYKPAFHLDGHIDGVYIYAEDITKLKEKSRALKFRESVLRTCLEAIPDSFFSIDRDRNILLINQTARNSFKNLHDVDIEEGTNLKAVFEQKDPNISAFWETEIYPKVYAGQPYELLSDYKTDKGEAIYFSSKIAPIFDEEGNVQGAVFTSRDITELKLNEKKLSDKNVELQKYIESNLQLENFAHLASHDLKAPLNTILNFTNLLDQKSQHKLDAVEQDFIRFTINAATNMQQTIDALLRFSRVSNSKIKSEWFNPCMMVNKLLEDLHSNIKDRSGRICVGELPRELYGDQVLIREVFQNLILNGIKFVQHGVTPQIEISSEENMSHWIFSVKDNGIGIAEKFQEKIFVMFKRLHKKEAYEGTGMGLAVCKKIIEQHQGKIWVNSQVGNGCTIYFSIAKNILN